MKQQAFSTGSITEGIVAFAQFSRSHGLNIGIQETQDALKAAEANLITGQQEFKHALKAIFCTSPEEGRLYDQLFFLFWETNPTDLRDKKNKRTIQGSVEKKTNNSLVMLGRGKTDQNSEEAKNISGANETERLKKTDLSMINGIEAEQLEEIARKLFREMAVRLRRRLKESRRNGQINLRRTIRKSIAYGGEPLDLYRKARSPKKQRLVILLDISGSMDKYSFFLLRFICALRENFRQLEAFVFSTSLIKVSKALQHNRLDLALASLAAQTDTWSGGTKIGACLQEFSERHGKQILNGSPVVIIMSDGLDTGDISVLGQEMVKLQRKSKRLIWLNPLKGMKGYEPLAAGMKTALPSVNDFRSAHNLESILELENILADA
jgi:uncharacterized protein with von Willebrand factor type A (vWA) domain